MAKSYTRKANPQKFCIFCGESADSREHFWPTWLHPLIVKPKPGERHDRRAYQYHPSTGERTIGPVGRPGGVHTIRIRAVCKQCNNGWMNRLEGEARPYITALAKPENRVLGDRELYIVAKWITLKCIVAEHSIADNAVTPLCDRVAFKEQGVIPHYFRIYVARNVSNHRIGSIRHSHCIALSPEGPIPPLDGTAQNIQTLSFLIGEVFIQVNAARIQNFDLESRVIMPAVWNRCRIWPLQIVPTIWPRRPNLDSIRIRKVSSALERFINVGIALDRATWADTRFS